MVNKTVVIDTNNHTNGDNGAHFLHKGFNCVALGCTYQKWWKWLQRIQKTRQKLFVRILVLESYKNCWTQPQGGGSRHPSDTLAIQVCEVCELSAPSRWPLLTVWEYVLKWGRLSCQTAAILCFCPVPGNLIIWLVKTHTSTNKNKHRSPRGPLFLLCLTVCVSVSQ